MTSSYYGSPGHVALDMVIDLGQTNNAFFPLCPYIFGYRTTGTSSSTHEKKKKKNPTYYTTPSSFCQNNNFYCLRFIALTDRQNNCCAFQHTTNNTNNNLYMRFPPLSCREKNKNKQNQKWSRCPLSYMSCSVISFFFFFLGCHDYPIVVIIHLFDVAVMTVPPCPDPIVLAPPPKISFTKA